MTVLLHYIGSRFFFNQIIRVEKRHVVFRVEQLRIEETSEESCQDVVNLNIPPFNKR